MRDLLLGVLLPAVGAAGLAWQLEGPSSAGASARPALVCPLGSHGLAESPVARDVRLPGVGWR